MKRLKKKILMFAAAAVMLVGSAGQAKAETVPLFNTAKEAQKYVQQQLLKGTEKVTVDVCEDFNIGIFNNVVIGSEKYDANGELVRIPYDERDQWMQHEVSQLFGVLVYKKTVQRGEKTVYEAVYGEKSGAKASAANYRKLIADLPSIVKQIGAESAKTDEQKAKIIFDYVRGHVTYGGNGHASDAYVEGEAICGGYTGLFYILAQKVGLDVRMMIMNGHAWNIVKVDGKWYEVDTTYASSGPWIKGYDYFLAGTEDLTDRAHTYPLDYQISNQNKTCPTEKYSYYKKVEPGKPTDTDSGNKKPTNTDNENKKPTNTDSGNKKPTDNKAQINISSCKVSLQKTSYFNDGTQRTPAVTVKTSAGKTLKKNTDYRVKYAAGRKAPGKYNVTITGIGNYKDFVVRSFTIKKKIKLDTPSFKSVKRSGKVAKITIKAPSKTNFQIRYRKTGSKKWKQITTKKTSIQIKKLSKGKYQFGIRAVNKIGGKNYTSPWSKTKTA